MGCTKDKVLTIRALEQRDQLEDTNKRQSQEISDLERQITSLQQDLQQVRHRRLTL